MSDQEEWGARILRVVDHIHAHLPDDLTPEALADLSGFSLHHFHRVFRGLTGESVMGFVRRLRLERAATRLKIGHEPVTTVALGSGYKSHEAFTRAFRSRFGESPSGFRARVNEDAGTVVEVAYRDEPARTCLALRHVGSYENCGDAWQKLMGMVASHGLMPKVGDSLGLCYDDPDVTPVDRLRYDACLVLDVAPHVEPPIAVCTWRTIPAGRYAFTTHLGPYESIFETYVGFIGRTLPFRKVDLANEPVVERYLNNPTNAAPADLRTEVCVRIT